MSNSITNQTTWMLIDEVNYSNGRAQVSQKQGEARVAEENSSTVTVESLQKFEKDVLVPSNADKGNGILDAESSGGAPSKAPLPSPKQNWSAFQGSGAGEPGLISIIGTVLALQSKTNSNFWSTLWQQASKSMMMEVQFAPIIGNAIRAQYDAEAAATKSQADQAAQEGIISMVMFGTAVLMAGYMEWNDEASPGNKGEDVESEVETKAKMNGATQTEQTDLETNKLINNQDESNLDRLKRYWNNFQSKFSKGQARFTSLLGKGIQTTTMMSMASDGITKYFVTSKHQAEQAMYQAQQGGCQALSQEAQQYSQFYGQDFSREEDLRQGTSQNIDYAMNILKSAADSITQTVTSMFRG
jgi:hypothetical protein